MLKKQKFYKNDMDEILKKQVGQLNTQPGVYLFKNKVGKIIYVGKALNLKNRVSSYFRKSNLNHPKLIALNKNIYSLETIIVDNEVEALILESNLIKKHKPRYNVDLKDDKSFPYLRITKENFPRVFTTRNRVNDGSVYLGPYTDVKNLRKILKSLGKIFPIRSCKYNLTNEAISQKKYKICLDYHINRCFGPCEGLVLKEEYNQMIRQVIKLLKGKTKELISELTEKMQQYSKEMQYEKAARARDQIKRVNSFFFEPPKVAGEKFDDMDIIAFSRNEDDGVVVIFQIRDGKGIGRQHFFMNHLEEKSDEEILETFFLKNYLDRDFIPLEVIIPLDLDIVETYKKYFKERKNITVNFIAPKIGGKKKILQMVQKNADFILADLMLQKIKKEETIHHSVIALQRDLRLKNPPLYIETFDISNIQGKFPVASMVYFHNGRPFKKEYRHYHIKSQDTPDDFLMMREVVERRYSRLKRENKNMPDLILIDGGKGQISSVLAVLKKLGLEHIPMIGLAKRMEEIFFPGKSEPLIISKTSAGLKLLQQMRDEAHRFAISFHRKTRNKYNLHSELDDIPNIGPERKKALLKHFKTVENIRNTTLEKLIEIPGFNKRAAESVLDYFK